MATAEKAWEKAKELIRDERNSMVLLDEINIALRYDYIDVAEVVRFLKEEKPHMTHVVLTGRNAKEELIEAADLVTEMELIKHPFRSGIKATGRRRILMRSFRLSPAKPDPDRMGRVGKQPDRQRDAGDNQQRLDDLGAVPHREARADLRAGELASAHQQADLPQHRRRTARRR